MAYGIITQAHTLQQLKLTQGLTVLQYGEQNMWGNIDAALRASNAEVALMLGRFCRVTNLRAALYGGDGSVEIEELTSQGRSQGESFQSVATVGYPLRKWGKALGWVRDALAVMQVKEFAVQATAIITADKRNVIKRIQRAIYLPTSYTYYDKLLDNAPLPVKPAGLNADGSPIPVDPYGNEFNGSTHTHYLARAGGALAEADLDALIATLTEHTFDGTIKIEIDTAQESAIRGFTNFERLLYVGQRPSLTDTYNDQGTLDVRRTKDRVIGYYKGYEVAVRYTSIPGYVLAYVDIDDPERKPVAIRVRGTGEGSVGGDLNSVIAGAAPENGLGFGDLQLVYDHDDFPLRAKEWQREFDAAGNYRPGIAVLYANGTSYVAPTI